MRLRSLLTASLAVSTVPGALGYPGMSKRLEEVQVKCGQLDEGDSFELLGDLLHILYKDLTPTGKLIRRLLRGKDDPESDETYGAVPSLLTPECRQDTCCVWKYIADDMYKLFLGKSGRCTKWARFAVRLGFHDAGTWSKETSSQGGGADGSIVLSGTEILRSENRGLQEIVVQMQVWYDKYHTALGFPISMADLIQMGATVAAVTCPLGPRIRSFVGRNDSSTPAPNGLLPDVFADADTLIQLFRNKTIGPHGLTALVGAHTTSQQHFVNVTRAGDPQDSSPGVWDVLFYGQTLGPDNGGVKAPKRVFKFPSDVVLSVHPEISKEWHEFAGSGGQDHWNEVRP